MLVASGPAIALLLAEDAEARVCGQTGVSPICPTFDCDDVWGWCWYATGCCVDGQLKKICDCCAVNWPNVHGYCPAGTNVKCAVESCGTDPRVMTAGVTRFPSDDPAQVARHARETRYPGGAPAAVIADADHYFAAVATAFAGFVGGPVYLVSRGPLDPSIHSEIKTRWGNTAWILGPALPESIDAALTADGIAVTRLGAARDPQTFSGEVAQWIRNTDGVRDYVCIEAYGVSGAVAQSAASFASAAGLPLVIGADTPSSEGRAYLVGPEAAVRAADYPGSAVLTSTTVPKLSAEIALHARQRGIWSPSIVLAPDAWGALSSLASIGYPVVVHEPGGIASVREGLLELRNGGGASLFGTAGTMDSDAYKHLQSILNGFDTHKLIGVGGQGLPVYSQPVAEREIGRARIGTDPPPPRTGGYWTRRGRRRRRRRR